MIEKQYLPVIDEKFSIPSFAVDLNGRLKLNYLTAFLQETAWKHANHLDFGYAYMKEKNVAWMLSKLMVKVDEFPKWNDEITIETWPKGMDGISYIRDFFVKNNTGKIIVEATSYWLLVDMASKRPRAPELHRDVLTMNKNKHGINVRLAKITANCDKKSETLKVKSGDIDLNNHVNSNKYVEWVTNILFDISISKNINTFQINFLHEVYINEEIVICYSQDRHQLIFEGINETSGTRCFHAVIKTF